MMPTARKLTMQLTPLLDLLLIVIFAQFMEVREAENLLSTEAAQAVEQLRMAEMQTEQLQRALAETQQRLSSASQAALLAQQQNARQAREYALAKAQLDRSTQRQRILGTLMAELFHIPKSAIDDILDPARVPVLSESSAEFQKLRQQFADMAEARPYEVVKHLLTYDEIRKRCDVWEIHLSAKPAEAVLESSGRRFRFGLRIDDGILDQDHFEEQMYRIYESLEEPKSLVIILLTYDGETRNSVAEPAAEAIRSTIERMRSDTKDRVRFGFADLGIPM